MKKYSRILIIANLLLLLGYFSWSVYKKEQILKNGQLVLFELAPVDPRSLMQGDYMSLRYKGITPDSIDELTTATRGYAILSVDSNQVAHIIRLQKSLKLINNSELAIKYKIVNNRIVLGPESFFFEEGQGDIYQNARYGGLKVSSQGENLLIGLYDENYKLLQPDKQVEE